jgi:phenylacetate-CoA ligase
VQLSFGETLRNQGFNLYAKYVNKDILDTLHELDYQYKADISGESKDKLAAIIKHAVNSTKFYSVYGESVALEDLPVISKEHLKQDYYSFVSNAYSIDELIVAKTSGSYGAPMKHLLTKKKSQRRALEAVYYNSWADYKIGMKHILNSAGIRKSNLSQLIQNEVVFDLSNREENWFENVRNRLRLKDIKFYIGYSSALSDLVTYCEKIGDHREDYALIGIIAIGEALPETTRIRAESLFGCKVLSRYATLEFGVLAHECPEIKNFHLNRTGCYFELLSLDSDQPVRIGEVGRVVVTDYYSFGMPLIRYDTGDLAIMSDDKCGCGRKGPVYKNIEGRLIESLLAGNGQMISGFIVIQMMRHFDSVIGYRLIQKERDQFLLILKVEDGFLEEEAVRREMMNILGENASLKIDYVKEIPVLKSGKRPYVVNEYLYNERQL